MMVPDTNIRGVAAFRRQRPFLCPCSGTHSGRPREYISQALRQAGVASCGGLIRVLVPPLDFPQSPLRDGVVYQESNPGTDKHQSYGPFIGPAVGEKLADQRSRADGY